MRESDAGAAGSALDPEQATANATVTSNAMHALTARSMRRCEEAPPGHVADMNRFFRRMSRFGKSRSVKGGQDSTSQASKVEALTPPDVSSVRAKSSGHRKRTADKWNQ
jgi:hypothetical protein